MYGGRNRVYCALQDLSNVKYMSVRNLPKLESLPTGGMRSVQHLQVHHCPALSSIDLRGFSALTTLDVKECGKLTHLPGLGQLDALERFYVDSCQELELPDDLSGMTSLEELWMHNSCTSLTTLSLQFLKMLKYIYIHTQPALQQLGDVEQLTSLEKLCILNCPGLKAVLDLSSCTKLKKNHPRHMQADQAAVGRAGLASTAGAGVGGRSCLAAAGAAARAHGRDGAAKHQRLWWADQTAGSVHIYSPAEVHLQRLGWQQVVPCRRRDPPPARFLC
jgi:hypothetical protein